FVLVEEWKRADADLDAPQLAPLPFPNQPRDCKGPRPLLEVQEAKPPGGFKGEALAPGTVWRCGLRPGELQVYQSRRAPCAHLPAAALTEHAVDWAEHATKLPLSGECQQRIRQRA